MSFSDFDEWNRQKKLLDVRQNAPHCKRGEVWLCNIGRNVGYEMGGSVENVFTRLVLVIKVMSENTFWGLPITSANKDGRKDNHPLYYEIEGTPEILGFVALSQFRLFDTKRLIRLKVRLDKKIVDNAIKRLKEVL